MAAKDFVATELVLIVVAAWLWPGSDVTNYTVGDSVGWKAPPNGTKFYDSASLYTIEVGDILILNFHKDIHDVTVVTKDDFDACNTGSPIETLNTGDFYFICTFPTNCSG